MGCESRKPRCSEFVVAKAPEKERPLAVRGGQGSPHPAGGSVTPSRSSGQPTLIGVVMRRRGRCLAAGLTVATNSSARTEVEAIRSEPSM